MARLRLLRLKTCLLAYVALSIAQEPTGGVMGSVSDPSGATVPRATVTVEDQGTGRTYSVQTADNGQFTFPDSCGRKIWVENQRAGIRALRATADRCGDRPNATHSYRAYDLRP